MDPAVAALNLTKAAAIITNMIESYLAGGAPLPNMEGADHDEFEDGRSPSGAASLHLHSPIDAGPGPLQSRKQGTPVQSGEPSEGTGLDAGADPNPRRRSRPLRRAGDPSRRLQDSSQRCRNGSSRRHLLPGSLAPGAIQQGLAQVIGTVRDHQNLGVRRRWLLRSSRLQRRSCTWHKRAVRTGRTPHYSRAPPRSKTQQGAEG